jgi:hypothetical protein
LVTGILLAAPLLLIFFNFWLFAALSLSILLGLIIAGWGPFMGMGHETPPLEPSWIDFFPKLFGFNPITVAWDSTGMLICGVLLYFLPILSFSIISFTWWLILLIVIAAIGFTFIYWITSKIPTNKLIIIPGFTTTAFETLAEILVGVWTSIILLITCGLVG